MLQAAPCGPGSSSRAGLLEDGASPPQPRGLQGGTGPSWVPVCLEVTRWEATWMPPPAAWPWQALGCLPCLHLLLGRTPTSEALGKSRGGERKRGGAPSGPGGQPILFTWSWVSLGTGGLPPAPPPALLASARWGRGGRRAASWTPAPGPAFPDGRPWSTLAPGREATAALGRGGYQGCPPRSGQGQGAKCAPPPPAGGGALIGQGDPSLTPGTVATLEKEGSRGSRAVAL